MKRSLCILFVLLLSAVLLTVTACGGDGSDTTTTTKPTYYGSSFSYRLYEGASIGTYDCGYVSGGKAYYDLSAPAREGYVLLGLYNDEGEKIIDGEGNYLGGLQDFAELTCHWVSKTCTLYLEAEGPGGEPLFSQTISLSYGEALPTLPIPSVEGYEAFTGWYRDHRTEDPTCRVSGADGVPIAPYTFLTVDAFPHLERQEGNAGIELAATLSYTEYTLTFDYNDGSGRKTTDTFLHHIDAEDIEGPTVCEGNRDIYAWSTSKTELIPPTTLSGNSTLYGFWRPCRTVTLHNGYGVPDSTVHLNADFKLSLTADTEAYYSFVGWYTSADFAGAQVDTDTAIAMADAADHYYRKLKPITYRASFYSNGGSACSDITFTVEDEHLVLPVPTKENYIFKGWTNEHGAPPILELHRMGGNQYLYAAWEGEARAFVYDGDIKATASYGSDYRIPPIAPPDGMLFCGWTTEGATPLTDKYGNSLSECTVAEAETAILPIFKTARTLTLLVEDTAIAKLEFPTVFSVAEGESYTATVTWKSTKDCGYRFLGWYNGDTLVSADMSHTGTMPTADTTLIAKFTPASYAVTLDTANADFYDGDGTATVFYREAYSLPVAFKQGHNFLGWEHATSQELVTDATGASLDTWRYISNTVTLRPRFERSADSAILVYDLLTFLAIKDLPNGKYTLVRDIDMEGITWTPFAFGGVLDGNGHTVENLTVSTEGGNAGMFTSVSGTVKNLTFINLDVTSTAYEAVQVGGVCGYLSGTLSGITVESGCIKNNAYGTSGGALHEHFVGITSTLGGLVGLSDGRIIDCENVAEVISETYVEGFAVGGVAGFVRGGSLEGTANRGAVQSYTKYTGGVAGACWYAVTLRDAENLGNVTGTTYVGGVFGYLKHHFGEAYQVANLKNHGTVSGSSTVGGVVGEFNLYWEKRFTTPISITAFQNDGTVTASASSGVAAVGGIFGKVHSQSFYYDGAIAITLSAIENKGDVTSNGGTGVGGFIGHLYAGRTSYQILASTQNGIVSGSGTTLDVGSEIGKYEE